MHFHVGWTRFIKNEKRDQLDFYGKHDEELYEDTFTFHFWWQLNRHHSGPLANKSFTGNSNVI